MKNLFLSGIAVLTGVLCMIGCGNNSVPDTTATSLQKLISISENTAYTIQDFMNLQDFLLSKQTQEDLTGKPYDLNNDGIWNSFDLCIMKEKINKESEPKSDILVTYFSRTGTTEAIADYIIELTDAESFVIEAEIPYTDEDIQYSNSSCRANQEQNDKTVRPGIADKLENIEQYNVIFLGYPIWWGEEPRIIDTFLESYDFSGATVIPFCTSHSSGMSTSENNIKNLGVKYGDLLNGKRFSSSSTKEDVSDWIDSLKIKDKETEEKMNIEVNGHILKATLENNSSAQAFKELIKSESLTLNMNDYANFEKVGTLPESLPRNDEQITTEAGDIILYQGNQITIYYDENTWNFTRLGKIDNISQTELKEILGDGSVSVTFSLED